MHCGELCGVLKPIWIDQVVEVASENDIEKYIEGKDRIVIHINILAVECCTDNIID